MEDVKFFMMLEMGLNFAFVNYTVHFFTNLDYGYNLLPRGLICYITDTDRWPSEAIVLTSDLWVNV
jgi:hypothetical protein